MRLRSLALVPAVLAAFAPIAGAAPSKCFGEEATIVGTDESDVLYGTGGPDVIVGGEGHDEIHGLSGADLICGNGAYISEEDTHGVVLWGRGGPDVLRGRGATDALMGEKGRDRTYGDKGRDFCQGERKSGCELKEFPYEITQS